MDDWDAQKMLDKYIHDYMIRKNLHTAAETFAKEADISPEPPAVNPPDGFLTEWWSLFWDVYSAKIPNQSEATKDSADKNVSSVFQRPNMNCMPSSVCPPPPTPRLPDFLPNVYSTMIPRPDTGSMMQSALPTMISRPELNSNGLGLPPVLDTATIGQGQPATNWISENMSERERLTLSARVNSNGLGLPPMLDTTIGQGQPLTSWISENMSEQERLALSARDLNFNARLLNVDQLASLPPFSMNSRYLQKGVQQKPQRPVFINGGSRTYLGSSSAVKAVPHEALKLKQAKSEPDDTGRDKENELVSSGGWPSSQDSISYSVEQSVGKLMLTNLGSSCALVDDAINAKDLQSGRTATIVDPLDGYIQSFFSNEEDPNEMSSSFCTSPGSSLSRGEFQPKGK
ncbi:uncharacterized protein [Henckelia pumila]|uniref:uncharacterized protein n=1 Tax=Henckelia pumila TaxID=405737 RepID=UPI003C6E702F